MTLQPINYKMLEGNQQLLEITLAPGETILAEAGALVYMDEGIAHETCLGDGSEPNQGIKDKIFPSATRILTGDAIFYTYFTNYGRLSGKMILSLPYPSAIQRIMLSDFNNEIILQKGSFLCSRKGVKLSPFICRTASLSTKDDYISLYKLSGEGEVFVSFGGTLVERELNNELIHVDINTIVAFDSGVELCNENRGEVKTMILGNDAFVLGVLKGTGKVILQTVPLRKMILSIKTAVQHMNLTDKKVFGSLYED